DLAKLPIKPLLLLFGLRYLKLGLIQLGFGNPHFIGERLNSLVQLPDLAFERKNAYSFFGCAPARHQAPGDGALACSSQRDVRPGTISGTRRIDGLLRVVDHTGFGQPWEGKSEGYSQIRLKAEH